MTRCVRPVCVVAVVLIVLALATPVRAFEIEATTTVTRIIDGDTFDTSSQGKIRLADVNTPERGHAGYNEAKNALAEMVGGKLVFLDIDDVDPISYDRTVCVVYVRHNSTHLANVNKLLLDGGYAVVWDFDNESNPYTWTTYVQSPEGSQTSPQAGPAPDLSMVILVVAAMVILIAVVAVVFRSGRRRAIR